MSFLPSSPCLLQSHIYPRANQFEAQSPQLLLLCICPIRSCVSPAGLFLLSVYATSHRRWRMALLFAGGCLFLSCQQPLGGVRRRFSRPIGRGVARSRCRIHPARRACFFSWLKLAGFPTIATPCCFTAGVTARGSSATATSARSTLSPCYRESCPKSHDLPMSVFVLTSFVAISGRG